MFIQNVSLMTTYSVKNWILINWQFLSASVFVTSDCFLFYLNLFIINYIIIFYKRYLKQLDIFFAHKLENKLSIELNMVMIKPMLLNPIGKLLNDTRVRYGLILKINKCILISQRKQESIEVSIVIWNQFKSWTIYIPYPFD